MQGVLLINGFTNNLKFNEFYKLIQNAFEEKGIKLLIVKNTDIDLSLDRKNVFNFDVDFILFYDKDIALITFLELKGYKVFNCSKTIATLDDKGLTHLALINENIKMPKTRFTSFSYFNNEFIDTKKLIEGFNFPLIVKERVGSLGEQVYLVKNENEFEDLKKHISSNALIQEYISDHFHEDIRVYMVNHKVVGVCKRIGKDNDFRANSYQGGKMESYIINDEFKTLCKKISKILNMDFGGLDFILDKNDTPYFIEANSNAQFLNFYKTFNINIASFIADYMLETIKKH